MITYGKRYKGTELDVKEDTKGPNLDEEWWVGRPLSRY